MRPSPPTDHPTPTPDTVRLQEKMGYSAGMWARQMGNGGIKGLVGPVYNVELGISPGITGVILACMRLWDAITDPIAGTLSDNAKTRWGRRKPFIIVGGLLTGLCYPLIWMASPHWTENSQLVYLFSLCTIFYCLYSIFQVPFTALEFELTPDYNERTRIRVYIAYVLKLWALAFPWLYPLSQTDLFPDTLTGIRVLTGLAGLSIIAAAFCAGKIPRERYYQMAQKQERVSFFSALKQLATNRTFWMLKGIGLGMVFGHLLVDFVRIYVEWYYIWGGDTKKGATYTAIGANIATVVGIAAIYLLGRYFAETDKCKIIAWCLGIMIIGQSLKWFLMNPDIPELSLAIPLIYVPAITAFWALYGAMQGDFCDYDEHTTGKRREGVYSSVSSWMQKGISSIALGASGFIVVITGLDVGAKGDQTPETFFWLRVAFCAIPAACFIAVFILALTYPLTKKRMLTIRQELEARRGAA